MIPVRTRRSTDLALAAKLAAKGHVASARALVARHADGRRISAIEVDRTLPYLAGGARVHDRFDTTDVRGRK